MDRRQIEKQSYNFKNIASLHRIYVNSSPDILCSVKVSRIGIYSHFTYGNTGVICCLSHISKLSNLALSEQRLAAGVTKSPCLIICYYDGKGNKEFGTFAAYDYYRIFNTYCVQISYNSLAGKDSYPIAFR